jgi:hypothetical protein
LWNEKVEKGNLGNVSCAYLCDVLGRGSNPLELGLNCFEGYLGAAQARDIGELIPFEILRMVEERTGGVPRLKHVAVGFGLRYQRTTLCERRQVEEEVMTPWPSTRGGSSRT